MQPARSPRSPRAGNSTRVLHEVYLHRIDTKEHLVSQQIEDALDADASSQSSQCVKASGSAHRSVPSAPADASVVPSGLKARESMAPSPVAMLGPICWPVEMLQNWMVPLLFPTARMLPSGLTAAPVTWSPMRAPRPSPS